MTFRQLTFSIYALASLMSACAASTSGHSSSDDNALMTDSSLELSLPEVPKTMTDIDERAAFISLHFWDNMDWNDPERLGSESFMGQNMANYISVLEIARPDDAALAVNALIDSASKKADALNAVSDVAYNYLYELESPQYNPELYLYFVDALSTKVCGADSIAEMAKYDQQRSEIMKNRVGETPSDFEFIDSDGRKCSFYNTIKGAELSLLMLYDPECDVCHSVAKVLSQPGGFSRSVKNGDIKVIAINAFGQESGGRADRPADFPDYWTIGYSPNGRIDNDEIYVIRSAPAVYIIDNNGIILEKDVQLDRLKTIAGD